MLHETCVISRTCLFKISAALQVSTVIGAVVKSQREQAAWTEGVAIWVAVMVVSLVGDLLSHIPPSLLPAQHMRATSNRGTFSA